MSEKIRLTKKQLDFIKNMLERESSEEAVEEFAIILLEELVDPMDMPKVIDKIMNRMKK